MAQFTNHQNIPLSVAMWLAHDDYDHNDSPNYISATGLLKSIRQTVLTSRLPKDSSPVDISALVPSSLGTAIHNDIEKAWTTKYKDTLKKLGYPQRLIDRVEVNPDPNNTGEDVIPVYLEQRAEKEICGFTVSGKFDFVGEGRVEDFKSTSTFTYMNKSKDEDYILQGSIYRWLNPEIITQDSMAIQFIFTDWSAARVKSEGARGYPASRTLEYRLPLKSIVETEAWITRKLTQIKQFSQIAEEQLPFCTDKELWRKEPVYKYYKNPEKMSRATKNFETLSEANTRLAQDGGVGIVVEKKGEVVACKYCDAFDLCTQKDKYIADGTLII